MASGVPGAVRKNGKNQRGLAGISRLRGIREKCWRCVWTEQITGYPENRDGSDYPAAAGERTGNALYRIDTLMSSMLCQYVPIFLQKIPDHLADKHAYE